MPLVPLCVVIDPNPLRGLIDIAYVFLHLVFLAAILPSAPQDSPVCDQEDEWPV